MARRQERRREGHWAPLLLSPATVQLGIGEKQNVQQILEDVTSAPLRSTARSHIALKNILLCIVGPALLVLFMTGCGGGSAGNAGGGSPPSSPTAPSFTLSLTPSTVTVLQGGTEQAVQISVSGQNGFTGSVSVTFSNLPAGVTVSPTSLSIASGDETSFDLSASSSAAVGQQSLGVNGSSGALTADASLQLTVMGVAVQDPFHAIGGTLAHGFYDESRQLLFATNPGLNELDVISGWTSPSRPEFRFLSPGESIRWPTEKLW